MTQIILSNSENTFEYYASAINQNPDYLSLTIYTPDMSLEEIEAAFTGNNLIKIVDESSVRNFNDYIKVRSIEKNYVSGTSIDIDGAEVITPVVIINLEQPSLREVFEKFKAEFSETQAEQDAVLEFLLGVDFEDDMEEE